VVGDAPQRCSTVPKDDRFGKDKINARTPPWLPGMFKPLLRNMLDVDVPNHTRLRGLVQKIGPRISAAP
jgi:hypothetical protein